MATQEPQNQERGSATSSAVDVAPEAIQEVEGHEIELPIISHPGNYITRESRQVVAMLGSKSVRGVEAPPGLEHRLTLFLNWLETRPEGPNQFTEADRKILLAVLPLIHDPANAEKQRFFTESHKERARAINERLSAMDVDDIVDEVMTDSSNDEEEDGNGTTSSAKRRPSSLPDKTIISRLPPRNHPIFGDRGPMRGLAIRQHKRKAYFFNPNYDRQRKRYDVFGNNGLAPGAWWPMQNASVFNGAHGSFLGGISGNSKRGAHSIVTSGHYDDLDRDDGYVLYYSGSDTQKHTDPIHPKENRATTALHVSMRKDLPVRVLRSASGGGGKWCPKAGIRYDGLYKVVGVEIKKNALGGAFYQFKLERLPGQGALEDLKSIPNAAQHRQWEEAKLGY